MTEDEKYEKIGKTVFSITYFVFALRMTVFFSAAALIILLIIHKPLWIAPVAGVAAFLVYRGIRRLILRVFLRLGREGR
ncbi:MAG: hypothetical protein IKI78_02920 [Clostridia bacterium]|nr:hypothetical protein [Clostridia bacterium]